ncbi:MAG: hypothetical protein ACLRXC_10770 [[Clostridium] leptum]
MDGDEVKKILDEIKQALPQIRQAKAMWRIARKLSATHARAKTIVRLEERKGYD